MNKINRTVLHESVLTCTTFSKGGTARTINDRFITDDGTEYEYTGTFPVQVPAGSVPDSNWKPIGLNRSSISDIISSVVNNPEFVQNLPLNEYESIGSRSSQWINAAQYGFLPSNTPEQNVQACARVNAAVKSKGGGTLIIPAGVYTLGVQERNTPAGHDPDNVRAWGVKDNFRFEGLSTDLCIIMYGASFKLADGLRFGAFDPSTGLPRPYTPTSNDISTRADTGFIFNIVQNPDCNISIYGGTLLGSMDKLVLGGQWGDVGRQCDGYGFRIRNYKSLSIRDCTIIKMPLDGLYTGDGWYSNTYKEPKSTVLSNVKIIGCGRDNWSIVGNGQYSAIGCVLTEAAQHEVSSNPASNINVETEAGKVYQVVIDNCTLSNGRDANFIVTSQNVNGLSIINSLLYHDEKYFTKGTAAGVWMRGSPVDLHRCTLRNSRILNQVGGRGSSSYSTRTSRVDDCLITNTNVDGTVPSTMVALINSDTNHLLVRDCTISITNPITGKYHVQLNGCTLERTRIVCTGTVQELDSYTGVVGFLRNSVFRDSEFLWFCKKGTKRYGFDTSGTEDVSGSTFLSNQVNTGVPDLSSFRVVSTTSSSSSALGSKLRVLTNSRIQFSNGVQSVVTKAGCNNPFEGRGRIQGGRLAGLSSSHPFRVGDVCTLNGSEVCVVVDSGSTWVDTTSTMSMSEAVIRYQIPSVQ